MSLMAALAVALSLSQSAVCDDAPLRSYGVAALHDSASAGRLCDRFSACGMPLFFVHNVRMGVMQGDVIRFDNKAVLIDGKVWQTLRAEGVLGKLETMPIVFQRAESRSADWEAQANLAHDDAQKKVLLLGSEILKLLEDDFVDVPRSQQIVLQFNGGNAALIAPTALVRSLRYRHIVSVDTTQPPTPVSQPSLADIIVPPWDTLIVGHRYEWRLDALIDALARDGITLYAVEGSDSTMFADSLLVLEPSEEILHLLSFYCIVGEDTVVHNAVVPTRIDRPPVFVSRLDGWELRVGQSVRYKPAAWDPEDGVVAVRPASPQAGGLAWTGEELQLRTSEPGQFTAELAATDALGQTAYQRLYWEVEDGPADWYGGRFESKYVGKYHELKLYFRSPRGRLGLLTPCLDKIVDPDIPSLRHFPFVFVGVNMLNSEATRKGSYFFIDFGLTLRTPHPKVMTGGLCGGLDGRLVLDRPRPVQSEFELSFVGNQFIVAADTSGLIPALPDTSDSAAFVEALEELGEQYRPVAEGILGEGIGDDNLTILLRFETLFPLAMGFSVGPVFWGHIRPFRVDFGQRFGASLRFQKAWPSFEIEQTVRVGTGGTVSPFELWWDASVGLGAWRQR